MAKTKPKKKYNKIKNAYSIARAKAKDCHLHRWHDDSEDNGYFNAWGPFSNKFLNNMLEFMSLSPNNWTVVVISYFIHNDEYYEEISEFDLPLQLTLSTDMDLVKSIIDDVVNHNINEGNPLHYRNSFIAMYLSNSHLLINHRQDDKILSCVKRRAVAAFNNERGNLICQLEKVLFPPNN